MGFSFRKKSKKKKSAAKTAVKEATVGGGEEKKGSGDGSTPRMKKTPSGTKSSGRVRSKDYSSPLNTINETAGYESGMHETPSSVLESLNIVQAKDPGTYDTHESGMYETDESLEVVVGPAVAGSTRERTTAGVEVSREEAEEVKEEEKAVTHEDVRKVLFSDDQEDDVIWDSEDWKNRNTDRVNSAAVVTPEEQPYDAKAEFEADEMVDLEKTLPSDFGRQNRADMLETNVTRKLLDVFNCNEDTTKLLPSCSTKIPDTSVLNCVSDMFYDKLCGAYINGQKRPYYNEQFTLKFLQEVTKQGIPLLYHQPPSDPEVEDWTGRSVTMFVIPGNSNGAKLLQPSLEWSTMGGGWSRTGTSEVVTTSIDLLSIHSLLDSSDVEEERDDDGAGSDVCFFSVTTKAGDVHVFEAQSYEERDRIVNGLKNIIARLAYHLVAGDVQVSTELYSEDAVQTSGELPSLRTPTKAMNDISHSFLD